MELFHNFYLNFVKLYQTISLSKDKYFHIIFLYISLILDIMTDFVKKYKKHQMMTHISTALAGLVVAFWIHVFVIDDADISQLKTSVLDSGSSLSSQSQKSDLFFESNELWLVKLKTSQPIQDITRLSLSLTYNPQELEINSISPVNPKVKILNLSNIAGINTVVLEWPQAEDIQAWASLIDITTQKTSTKTTGLNILVDTIEFSDSSDDSYRLSTSWIQL